MVRMWRSGVLAFSMAVVALAMPTGAAMAQATAAPVAASTTVDWKQAIAKRVEREMKAQGLVGLSLAIGRGEAVVHEASFGFEDREAKVAASEKTMYRWASVSKPVTAVAAMQLWREGKLDLDADVRALVPEFPQKPQVVTVRQLLCHQGGIVHYSNGKVVETKKEYAEEHPFKSVISALDTFKESPLVNEPGAAYSYTTHGYILVSAAVERAAKRPFAEYVKERIATPLGMESFRPDYQWEEIAHRAKGYRKGEKNAMVPSTDTDVSWKLGGGGFISTAGDMARFGIGMLGGKVVDVETKALMWTPQKLRDGKATNYGLGFNVATTRDGLRVSHSGSQEKARTQLLILPGKRAEDGKSVTEGVVVAIMCNTESAELMPLAVDVARIVQEQK